MRLLQIISEIKELKSEPTHKSTMDICRVLQNNRQLFMQKIDEDSFRHLLSNFERLSESSPMEYGTSSYIREYEQAHSVLSFYVDRII